MHKMTALAGAAALALIPATAGALAPEATPVAAAQVVTRAGVADGKPIHN